MKNCIQCNLLIEDNKKFCEDCGTKQPEIKSNYNNDGKYNATIGDKNIISGNIIGKNEEIKVAGNATFNKIEDDTKKIIICTFSGKHLLRGRDSVVNCPNCKSDVSQDYYNTIASRCFNCDKKAHKQYNEKLEIILSDGIIDSVERIKLDSFATSLMIDDATKQKLEIESKKRKLSSQINDIGINLNELSGFNKIRFKSALELIFEKSDYESALDLLFSIHNDNVFNEEVAFNYYLLKAIYHPQDYIADFNNTSQRNTDIFWEDFWAFLPNLILNKPDFCDKIITRNKALYTNNTNDILLSEIIFYFNLYLKSNEFEYMGFAKALHINFDRNIKTSLQPLLFLIDKLIQTSELDLEIIVSNLTKEELFYFENILKSNSIESHQNAINSKSNTIKSNKLPFDNNPNDIVLFSIIEPFLGEDGKDKLKKSLMGVNFDKNGITATNSHVLITLPYPNEKFNGVYDIKRTINQNSSEIILINESYPNYSTVIPKYEDFLYVYSFDVNKLLQYTLAAMDYNNNPFNQVSFKYGNNDTIFFDGEYLSKVLNSCIELGHQNLYCFINSPSSALVFSTKTTYKFGHDELFLVIPFKASGDSLFKLYYDFNDETIYDEYGSIIKSELIEKNRLIFDDELLSINELLQDNHYKIDFKLNYLKHINLSFQINYDSLIIKKINNDILIFKSINKNKYNFFRPAGFGWDWQNINSITNSNEKLINLAEAEGYNSIKIKIPTEGGDFLPIWKKKIIGFEVNQDIEIFIDRMPEDKYNFVICIHGFQGKVFNYKLKFGNYIIEPKKDY